MAVTSGFLKATDGTSALQNLRADVGTDGSIATHHVMEVGGAVVTPTNPLPTQDAGLFSAIAGGKVAVTDAASEASAAALAALISGGKLSVTDAASEASAAALTALISGGKLSVTDAASAASVAALAALISGGKLMVSDANSAQSAAALNNIIEGGLTVADTNSTAYQGVVPLVPGVTQTPQRSIGFICTAAGNVTLGMPDGSSITLPITTGSGAFQTLPFAVTVLTLGGGAAGQFWNLK